MKLVNWRRNVLKKAYNEWHTTSWETLNAMVEDGRMDAEDFKFITGQEYVSDQPQEPEQLNRTDSKEATK